MANARYPIGKFSFEGPLNEEQKRGSSMISNKPQLASGLRLRVSLSSNSTRPIATVDGGCARLFTMFPTGI
jgi:hypothetical protein